MKAFLTEWIVNLTLFSLLSSLFEKILPGKSYGPYLRIVCGIVMILTLLSPFLHITGLEQQMEEAVKQELFQMEKEQLENDLLIIEERQKKKWEAQYREYLEESDGVEGKDAGNGETGGLR